MDHATRYPIPMMLMPFSLLPLRLLCHTAVVVGLEVLAPKVTAVETTEDLHPVSASSFSNTNTVPHVFVNREKTAAGGTVLEAAAGITTDERLEGAMEVVTVSEAAAVPVLAVIAAILPSACRSAPGAVVIVAVPGIPISQE
ncbi:hypothetical protein BJV78DRAFT_1352611 [Lactifluus subvellereus]|nr:hypothetical protein BJV78DRAFT_1352611 [Lactifluus subvellereus]